MKTAEAINIDPQEIYFCIWGKHKTAGGYK